MTVESFKGLFQTMFRTDLPEMLYPVQGREAKNHTLSGSTSPNRPYMYMGVPPQASNKHSNIVGTADFWVMD